MKESEYLNATADELEKRPWFRGSFMPDEHAGAYGASSKWKSRQQYLKAHPECPVCLLGAATVVLGNIDWRNVQNSPSLLAVLGTTGCGQEQHSVVTYNDYIAKDKRSCVRMLRKAAKLAAKRGT